MHTYKVIYLEGHYLKKKDKYHGKGYLDGIDTSKSLEALLIEQDREGFDLFTITPITGQVLSPTSVATTTTGFMVTFKRKSK